MFIVFGRDISLILQTHEISLHKNNSHDLHIVITHSLVFVMYRQLENCAEANSIKICSAESITSY